MNLKKQTIIALFLMALMLFLPVYSANALTISNIRVKNLTSNSADILWDTDIAADSKVMYGNYSYRNFSLSDAALLTEHAVTLPDLLPDSKYYYSITSASGSDSSTKGGDNYYFYTNIGDIVAPVVSAILVSTTETTATISWATSEASTSKIYYGETTALGSEVSAGGMLTQHNVQLTDLTNNTQYFYIANSCDAFNNCANSSLLSFVAQYADTTKPFINATIPTLYGSSQIDISGKTEQYTTMQLYQNDALKRALTTEYNGTFLFPAVVLDPAFVPNTIRLHAKDAAGNENDANYNITVDLAYPQLAIAPIPPISAEQTLKVNGSVDKNSTLKFYVSLENTDNAAPPAVENVSASVVTANSIKITWNPVNVTDLSKYAVYRKDAGRIATSITNSFTDVLVSTNTTYAYQVSAVDAAGNEGQKSAMLYITTLANGNVITELPSVVELDVITPQAILNNIQGNFSVGLSMQNGRNKIKIEATDNIGHTTTYENATLFDPNPPVITENNLGSLSPSYIPDVTVRGKVNKNATVYVYVNYDDESSPSYEKVTDPDGTFSIDISLTKEGTLEQYETSGIGGTQSTGLSGEYSPAYINKIKLTAKDSVGRESSPVTGDIKYTQCGFGAWWQINISEATPDMLTPKLMLIGMSQIGITSQVGWQGGYQDGNIIANPTVEIMPLSAEQKEKYDEDWLQSSQAIWSGDKRTGYIILKIRKLDSIIKGNTSLEKENNLSDHRNNECPIPGMGCIKIPLLLTIRFYDPNLPGYSISPGVGGTQGTLTQTQTLTQKQCWDVIVNIDRRAPSDKIPKAFLTSSVELLNATIDLIDMILKPLNQVKTWVFYGCMGSWVYSAFNWFNEKWNCEFSGGLGTILGSLIGGTNSMKKVAEQGQCDQAFPANAQDDNGKNQACNSCSDAIQRRISWDQTMHWVCDRIFCPAAPTLQNYVEEKKKNAVDFGMGDSDFDQLNQKTGNQLSKSSSDCEMVPTTMTGSVGKDTVKVLYDTYANNNPLFNVDCKKLHPYQGQCCGFEYMREWDSACGAWPKFGFNELQESYCLVHPEDTKVCTTPRKIFNSVAGFCDPQGKAKEEYVDGLRIYENEHKDTEAIGKQIFYRILEDKDTSTGKTTGITVERGYYKTKYINVQTGAVAIKPGQPSEVTQKVEFTSLRTVNEIKDVDVIDKNNPQSSYNKNLNAFRNDYKSVAAQTRTIPGVGGKTFNIDNDAQEVFDKILSAIGTTDKKYIVDPTSGLLRSIQCVCLPGITSYLSLYRSMMDAIRTCFNTILLTGDGNPGVCQAVLTQYVCDLIYDVIKCFTKKYSSGLGGRSAGGIGGFLGALTSAGTAVQKSVSGRYGGSTIWRTMFAERKLVHSICLFAFTGDWNLDVNTLLNENISVNIQSQPILYPCTRRFVSYNPVSNPSGLTTWSYHLGIGLVAGSPLSYRVYLKCSSGYTCDPNDFTGGKCDCAGSAEQTMGVAAEGGTGTLTAGQILDSDTYVPLTESKVRYDTTVLEWTWTDNTGAKRTDKQECSITQEGGKPPVFCSFDIGTGSYLCRLSIGQNTGEAYFEGDPSPTKTPFIKNDNLALTVKVAHQLPTDAKVNPPYEYCLGSTSACSYTKELKWNVKNQNKAIINEGSMALNDDKIYDLSLPNIQITEELFVANPPTTQLGTYTPNANLREASYTNSIGPAQIQILKGQETIELIYEGSSGGKEQFKYKTATTTPTASGIQTLSFSALIACGDYSSSTKKVTCGSTEIFIVTLPTAIPAATVIQYTPPPQTTIIPFICDNTEYEWTASFTLYDYVKDESSGNYVRSEQKTTYNGVIQEKPDVKIKVKCNPQASAANPSGQSIITLFTIDGKTGTVLLDNGNKYDVKIQTSEDVKKAFIHFYPDIGDVALYDDKGAKDITQLWALTTAYSGTYTLQGKVINLKDYPSYSSNTITAYIGEKCTQSRAADTMVCIDKDTSTQKCPSSFTNVPGGTCSTQAQTCCQQTS